MGDGVGWGSSVDSSIPAVLGSLDSGAADDLLELDELEPEELELEELDELD